MAGYNGYSKSNNAVDAEQDNRYPASVLAKKLKVSTAAVKACLSPCEWHHSSSWYNKVDYYDGRLLVPLFENRMPNPADYYDEEELTEAAETLLRLRAWHGPAAADQSWKKTGCTVRWIEWSGTRRRPKATERNADGCSVEFNGRSTYLITLPNGRQFTKRHDANGFYVFGGEHV